MILTAPAFLIFKSSGFGRMRAKCYDFVTKTAAHEHSDKNKEGRSFRRDVFYLLVLISLCSLPS